MKQQIEQALQGQLAVQFAFYDPVTLVAATRYADYTSHIAWKLAAALGGEALTYALHLQTNWPKSPWIRLEMVAPGYLNFHYQPKYRALQIEHLLTQQPPVSAWDAWDLDCQSSFRRTQAVLPHLPQSRKFYQYYLTELSWTKPEWECICMLSKFADLPISQYLDYLKNLARIIHCLYNEVTLISSDVRKNLALAGVLHATQVVFAQGFYLVGDQE